MRIQCPVAERRGFSVLVLRTLKSLAQLPHPSPLDAHSLLKNGEAPRASPGPGASHSLPLYLECWLTWALTSALSTWPQGCSQVSHLPSILRLLSWLQFLVLDEEGHTHFSPAPWGPLSTELLLPPHCIS